MDNPWVVQKPFHPDDPDKNNPKQAAFLSLINQEALYGGAVGGGKSSALLMAAAMYVEDPGFAALLLRTSYQQLSKPGALMSRAHEWWRNTAAHWNESEHTYTFPSGSKISFGYLENVADKYQYQSAEYQFIGWDELTQFRREDYTWMFNRLRRLTGSDVPIRMRGATNPGGFGHAWVLQRFLIEGHKSGRVFIPARLEDNPYLDIEEYERSLSELDPFTREQYRQGNWFAKPPGRKFKRDWFEIVDRGPEEAERIRWWDLAATEEPKKRPGSKLTLDDPDWTVGLLMARTTSGEYYVEDVVRGRWGPKQVQDVVLRTALRDKRRYGLELEIWMEQEPGSSGKIVIEMFQTALEGYTFHGQPSTGKKEVRANPYAAHAGNGKVFLVQGDWINDYLAELEQFPDPSVHDDQVDASSGPFYVLSHRGRSGSDIGYGFGVWTCEKCGHQFVFIPLRACPRCGERCPEVEPEPDFDLDEELEEAL